MKWILYRLGVRDDLRDTMFQRHKKIMALTRKHSSEYLAVLTLVSMDWCRENLNTGIHVFLCVFTCFYHQLTGVSGVSGEDFPTNPMFVEIIRGWSSVRLMNPFSPRRIAESHGFE